MKEKDQVQEDDRSRSEANTGVAPVRFRKPRLQQRKRGVREGMSVGFEHGLEQGIDKGVQQANREIACRMKDNGLSMEEIAGYMGLSLERVENLIA